MGQGLRKPVSSIVVGRHSEKLFRVGFAEMNGWRSSMEDAHVIYTQDTCGFFGVFDGHGGSQCSTFVAKRMTEEITKGPPEDDAAMRSLVLQLDEEFLKTKLPSGSTGTFAIVKPDSSEGEGRFRLRVGNVGDSRVLLGRADGTIVEGPGTDGGLTTDHKPDHPDEIARIERTGGTVELVQGVPRVNGDLAVSRAFGDEQHKRTGPSLAEQPVSADPEFTNVCCDSTDFVMLVCDGISEGSFPNREVVKLAADELRRGGDRPDPGAAATAVCNMALEKGSMDNLSCMIVLLSGGEIPGPKIELLPGEFIRNPDSGFQKAYADMAEHAGYSVAQAIEMRYDLVKQQLDEATADASGANGTEVSKLQDELGGFGDGPPEDMPRGSAERVQWFNKWMQDNCRNSDDDDQLNPFRIDPAMLAMARERGLIQEEEEPEGRCVRVGAAAQVQLAVEQNASLPGWGPEIEQFCGMQGVLRREDLSDNTGEVVFEEKNKSVWLPLSTLTDVMMEVCSMDQLRPAVEAHSNLRWNERLADTCGKCGLLLKADTDGTSNLRFPELGDLEVWLPQSCLVEKVGAIQDASGKAEVKQQRTSCDGEAAVKRQRTSA